MSSRRYSIGLDYGTNSVRALVVDVANGREVGTAVWNYAHGDHGVVLARDPNLARQHPADYVKGAEVTIKKALADAARTVRGFSASQVIGLGVDTTGSTPLPVDRDGRPLAFTPRFATEPAAMAWLWKDHTGVAEAAEITELARRMRPQYLAKCGGTYSSEWFFSKILHCLRTRPRVFDAAWLVGRDRRLDSRDADRHRGARGAHGGRLRRRPQGDVQRRVGRLSRRGVPRRTRPEAGRSPRAPPAQRPRRSIAP